MKQLSGLRSLQEDDLKMLSSFLEEDRYRSKDGLPWIWMVGLIESSGGNGEISEMIAKWEDEGKATIRSFMKG